MRQFWQPKWWSSFHLPLLADVATSEHHGNVSPKCLPLVFPLPILFQGWAYRASVIKMTLTCFDSILKAFWSSSHIRLIVRSVPTTCLNASWGDLSLRTLGLHFTHLRFPFRVLDKTRFCQHWHFSVTMYFSDSPIESKWSLAPFNSDIAFGSHTNVCHCRFYFRGSGIHKPWRLCYASHQHKADHAILLLSTPQQE